jgi:DNA-binding CsgD family transcriptional regulator
VAQGRSNRAIADALVISEYTAKFHLRSILHKLSAKTRAEAVAVGAKLDLV